MLWATIFVWFLGMAETNVFKIVILLKLGWFAGVWCYFLADWVSILDVLWTSFLFGQYKVAFSMVRFHASRY